MSKDIRSYFLGANVTKKTVNEDKPRKKVIVICSSDEEDVSPSKGKKSKVADKTSKSKVNKEKSKKRTILSSDEDEDDSASRTRNKKAKVDKNDHEEKLEVVEDLKSVFSQKPVHRINAVKVNKKVEEKPTKKAKPKVIEEFTIEDDDFDATLNQLDTSQIEDEYLMKLNEEKTSSFFKSKEKDNDDSKSKNKSPKTSPKKNSSEKDKQSGNLESKKEDKKRKDKLDIKHENGKEKKKKDSSKLKIEIERDVKSPKVSKPKSNENNDIIQEKIEKKKQHAMQYQNYLNRGGARNPGSKEVPQGAEQCLHSLSFVITGVLDSLEREEIEGLIKQYGGKVLTSVSKKLSYIIVGDEPGPSKMSKAEACGVKKLSEDGFLDLLRTRPAHSGPAGIGSKTISPNSDGNKRKRQNSSSCDDIKSPDDNKSNKKGKDDRSKDVHSISESKKEENKLTEPDSSKQESSVNKEISSNTTSTITSKLNGEENSKKNGIVEPTTSKLKSDENVKSNEAVVNKSISNSIDNGDHLTAMVEKYRPKDLKHIIGQTGEKSNAKKLLSWLTNWYKNHGKDSKAAKPKFSYRDDTGAIYKAALLSGPPGIGKTTTAYVVCSQLGYEVIEFNASDTRSKKLLQEQIAGILSNKTMKTFLTDTSKQNKSPRHVLLMDEVDGMAGNEDRGGMQELIAFIKSTEVPIICICNDRMSQKIRTLANYTFDLRFQKPRLEQIRGAMMSISFKEGIKVTPDEITKIILSTNQDIRQVINHIAILAAKSQTEHETKEKVKYKNLKLGPWEVVQKVFSAEEQKHMSIHDKSDLFFHDYSIAPLFVEENYPIVTPSGPPSELYNKRAKCTESLAMGDIVDQKIRSNQAWSLLPVQAMFSSVIPGTVMSGFINSRINFPSWLGKNSKTNKCKRILQDITVHTRLSTGASKEAVNLDYIKIMVNSILRPLAVDGTDGVDKAIEFMNAYHLTREDLDSLVELTTWDKITMRDPWQSIDTKTKTAFTKAYNKKSMFSTAGTKKKKSSTNAEDNDAYAGSDEEMVSDDEEDDKIENDKLIKAKTTKAKSAPTESKEKPKKTVKNTSRAKKK